MPTSFDPETLERFRGMPPHRILEEVKDAVYRAGGVSSDDFQDAYRELVERGVLSWEQVEEFDR